MYSQLNTFEEALKHFGTRVEVITCMEMGGKISSEDAYQMIKEERNLLKKVRKKYKKRLKKQTTQENPEEESITNEWLQIDLCYTRCRKAHGLLRPCE